MEITRHYKKGTFTIEATEKEINAFYNKIAYEEGYQKEQGDLRCAKLLELMRTALEDCKIDWD